MTKQVEKEEVKVERYTELQTNAQKIQEQHAEILKKYNNRTESIKELQDLQTRDLQNLAILSYQFSQIQSELATFEDKE